MINVAHLIKKSSLPFDVKKLNENRKSIFLSIQSFDIKMKKFKGLNESKKLILADIDEIALGASLLANKLALIMKEKEGFLVTFDISDDLTEYISDLRKLASKRQEMRVNLALEDNSQLSLYVS